MNKWFIIFLIFSFSVLLRLWNLNQMGRTWDEPAQAVDGYHFIKLIKKQDFGNPYWYNHTDHPPLTKYLYGLALHLDVANNTLIPSPYYDFKTPTFHYDWTYTRLVSVIFSSLTVILILLIGWRYFSPFIGIVASVILSTLPFFLGLSQIATIESVLIFFFTASVYSFLLFLDKPTIQLLIITGILTGLALLTKYTNILLFPLFIWIYLLYFVYKNKKNEWKYRKYGKILYILIISLATFFLLWPMPWFHLPQVLDYNSKLRISKYSVPEVFFGRLMLVPKIYYVVHFLITTPLLILGLFLTGLKYISDKKKWILYTLIAWFVLPFIQSFYNFRQHGIRYIIEIYAPFSLIAAIGFDFIVSKLTKNIWIKILYFIPILIYMFIVLVRITPYYLDYFNELVGGPKGVYEKRLFQLGWWGQGIREAVLYVAKVAPYNSRVGLAVEPLTSVPPVNNLRMSRYEEDKSYDYILVSYFMVVRERFDDSRLKKNYNHFYSVLADGASLIDVYKRK